MTKVLWIIPFAALVACVSIEGKQADMTFTGRLVRADNGEPLAQVPVSLYRVHESLVSLGTWKIVDKSITTDTGDFAFDVTRTGTYELRWVLDQPKEERAFGLNESMFGEDLIIKHRDLPDKPVWDR